MAGLIRGHAGGLVHVGGGAGGVVHTLCRIGLCHHVVIPSHIGHVLDNELYSLKVSASRRELFGQMNAIAIHPGFIRECINISPAGTLPGEGYGIGVALVTQDHVLGAVDLGGVVHRTGPVGVPAFLLAVVHGGIDAFQTSLVELESHHSGAVTATHIGHIEVCTLSLLIALPGLHGIGALGGRGVRGGNGVVLLGRLIALIPTHDHVVLVVLQAGRENILEAVLGELGGVGGDSGQGRQVAVAHHISGASGGHIPVAQPVDVSGEADAVGQVCHLFLQGGVPGLVLGVDMDIVEPAVSGLGVRHGQGHQEGVDGGDDILRHLGFHYQIQAQFQAIHGSGAGDVIGEGHGGATLVGLRLQSILGGSAVGGELFLQSVNQGIRGIPGDATLGFHHILRGETQCVPHIFVVHPVDDLDGGIGGILIRVHINAAQAQVRKLHTAQGVVLQHGLRLVVFLAGGHQPTGAYPRLSGGGEVILGDGETGGASVVDGGILGGYRPGPFRTGQGRHTGPDPWR